LQKRQAPDQILTPLQRQGSGDDVSAASVA
jgi:hypothetical protein